VTQPLGLRTFALDPVRGFMLNGEPYRLYGVTRHQEWQDDGSALSDDQHRQDMATIYEIGASSVRLAHYQQSDAVYAEADRLGLVVWAEIPWVNRSSGQEGANAAQQLTELIRQNVNHPSIFTWGLLNEVYATDATAIQVQIARRLHDVAKTEDPDRPNVSTSGYGDLERPMNWHADLQAMNRYLGWYEGKTEDLEPWLRMIERMRPDGRVAIGEYGAEGNVNQHAEDDSTHEDPESGQFFPEEYQTRFHERQWAAILRHPAIWGTYVWTMFDFAVPGWSRGGVPARNQKGLVTYDRKVRKDAFFFYKANWSTEPVLHLADRRLATRTQPTMRVTVYSNVDATTVQVNGQTLPPGRNGGSPAHWVWDGVALRMGENVVAVTGRRGAQTFSDTVVFTRIR
jgi:beta-galactosidase